MKTAISLPDALFDEADAVAYRLGVSRSQLYATALAEYIAKFIKAMSARTRAPCTATVALRPTLR
ncbi:MAG: hypothetical protein U5K74_09270 [Gemmatimonadaceae bacterium]|nr:hypothetical protein [Gemmatimonadaceae bacterium]